MTSIKGIYTIRDTRQLSYWDIVFEWEDEFSSVLGVPLIRVGQRYDRISKPALPRKILNRLNGYQLADLFFKPKDQYLAFHIGPPGSYSFYTRPDVVPVIIDFWKYEDLSRFEKIFRLSPVVLITSYEVFLYLKEKKVNLPLEHLALSLPDRFYNKTQGGIRDIDMIQIGRRNAFLDSCMSRFLETHPDTHYVRAERTGDDYRIISNKHGDMGIFEDRASFINLLRRAKISLVSAPGMDEGDKRTGGFSPVTPRFLESAASGCWLIGAYPENDDFVWYGIREVCESVKAYDAFERQAIRYLADPKSPDYSTFLQRHLTSERARQLLKISSR